MGFLDSGMVVVLFITMVLLLVTGLLLFYDFKVENLSLVSFSFNKIDLCYVLYICAIVPLHCMKKNCRPQTFLLAGKTLLPNKKRKSGNKY